MPKHCTITWTMMNRDDWHRLLMQSDHVPITQSYYYAQAMRETKQQNTHFGLIHIDDQPAGVVQRQDISVFGGVIHIMAIDRGPCWFPKYGDKDDMNAFSETLNTQYPHRFGRKRRFIPENDGISPGKWMKNNKIKQYKSYLLDISRDYGDLRKEMDKKWRNHLNKSEKMGIDVRVYDDLTDFSMFLSGYMRDISEKRYAATSAKFLSSLAKYAAFHKECLLLYAYDTKGEVIAAICVFIHGRCATYQAGWTTDKGRKTNAHYKLLWDGVVELKKRGVIELDMGGYHDDVPGIQSFKKGIGGREIALFGGYK